MRKILNITNGDSAVDIMQQAGIVGDFLPWRDVLHDGPVPDGLDLDNLSQVRSKFISDCGWGSFETISKSFIERDNMLKSYHDYEKVVLWFEHDLYDQLQIIQILDWFNQNQTRAISLSIICVDQYLGLLTPEQMSGLFIHEIPISVKHLNLSTQAWSAFRSADPEEWQSLLNTDTSVLPFLEGAIIRQLEEYPDCKTGLSRTAKQILNIVAEGENKIWNVFAKSQKNEERIYIGDSSFWMIVQELLGSNAPLLELSEDMTWTRPPSKDHEVKITKMGEAVLMANENWLALNEIDRWIGGVHLSAVNKWCWDLTKTKLKRKTS